jgi:transposase-like protein
LDTKRNGKASSVPVSFGGGLQPLQRFWCKSCLTTFTHERRTARPRARFADDVVQEAVRTYVQGLASYRVLANMLEHRLGWPVSRVTLNSWVQEFAAQAQRPIEVSLELAPKWGGFLGVDGKAIYVRGNKHCLLIGVDHPTQDLVHALVLESETADGFARLVTEARLDAGYPLKGVVADLGPGFAQAHRDHFGVVPFQACRVHFDRRLDSNIPKAKWSKRAPLYVELKERIRAVLFADTHERARLLADELIAERKRFKDTGNVDVIHALRRGFDLYAEHHLTPGLPADNNVTENVIKQLNKKLRLMEGFESIESAERYVRLLVNCYRFKRFTDSCRKTENGKSPLELAGVDLTGRDWLSFLIDH